MAEQEQELKQKVSSQTNIPMDQIIFDGTTKTPELPKAHGKGIHIFVHGRFKLVYTTAPTAKDGGIIAHIIPRIEIKDSKGLLKDLMTVDLQDMTERKTGDDSPLVIAYTDLASDGLNSTTNMKATKVVVPASGKYIHFMESVHLPFECEIAEANFLDTLLQYNGRDNNTMRLIMAKLETLFTGGTGVVISDMDIRVDMNYLTMANSGLGRRWKQWIAERPFSAPATKSVIELNAVDSLMGLKIEITKGKDRLPITAEEAKHIKFDLSVRKNGIRTYLHSDESLLMLAFQDANKKSQYKIDPSRGYMNLITGNLLESAEQNTYTEMSLLATLPSNLTFDPNNQFNVRVLVDEVE